MAWFYLAIAGVLEVVWATAMKQSHGFTKLIPSIVTIATMTVGIGLLSLAMRTLPLGTAYAAWTGIGALGAFVVGIVWLGEPAGAVRIASAALILTGIVGLKLGA